MFKDIVIPVDPADKNSIQFAVPIALNLANVFCSNLHFVHIIPDFGMKMIEDYLPRHWFKDQKTKSEQQMRELIKQYLPENMNESYYIGRGVIYDEVIQYVNEVKADLIIVSAVCPKLKDYMLGSNASKIVRHAGTSVMVIRE